jgi:hypothetical protein
MDPAVFFEKLVPVYQLHDITSRTSQNQTSHQWRKRQQVPPIYAKLYSVIYQIWVLKFAVVKTDNAGSPENLVPL